MENLMTERTSVCFDNQDVADRVILEVKSGIFEACENIEDEEPESIIECLNCGNCDFKVMDAYENVITDYTSMHYKNLKNLKIERYVIEYFDDIDKKKILHYLKKSDSDYRLTRKSDGTIMHSFKKDEAKVLKKDFSHKNIVD